MKVSELSGAALDWAVAKAEGLGYRYDEKYGPMCFRPSTVRGVVAWDSAPLPYSTDWAQGGPIIEREEIAIDYDPDVWNAAMYGEPCYLSGPTPLVAAMRCYVASKLGDGIEIPKELT